MNVLTRAQRIALKRVYDRGPITNPNYAGQSNESVHLTYRQFRRGVQQGHDCIMIHWAGMWLGIESDGYTHS